MTLTPATTSEKGVATFEGLAPGRYTIRAEFPGFEPGSLKDVRVRSGDNKHIVILGLKKVEEAVTVSENAQTAAADPRGNAFKEILTREEIDALSDDPAEMAQQLLDMAGGNAVIRIDSFYGGRCRRRRRSSRSTSCATRSRPRIIPPRRTRSKSSRSPASARFTAAARRGSETDR